MWVTRVWKLKGAATAKEFIICNKREEKETIETTSNLHSSSKEMILLWAAEVYVIHKRNNKEIKWKFLFDSGSEASFFPQRAYTRLQLLTVWMENLKINIFGNKN